MAILNLVRGKLLVQQSGPAEVVTLSMRKISSGYCCLVCLDGEGKIRYEIVKPMTGEVWTDNSVCHYQPPNGVFVCYSQATDTEEQVEYIEIKGNAIEIITVREVEARIGYTGTRLPQHRAALKTATKKKTGKKSLPPRKR